MTMKQGFGSLELREGAALSNILHPSPRSRNLPSQLQWKKILLINAKLFSGSVSGNSLITQLEVPYSGKFLLVRNASRPSRRNFRGFYFCGT